MTTDNDQRARLMETGRCAYSAIAEMVAALNCDYDRLDELRDEREALQTMRDDTADDSDERDNAIAALETFDREHGEELAELIAAAGDCEGREDAEQRIQEDALEVLVRDDWHTPGQSADEYGEYQILLSTGGPAARIVGDLNKHSEPQNARLQVQDWLLPWTDYRGTDERVLLDYARCFWFGE